MLKAFKKLSHNYTTTTNKYNELTEMLKRYNYHLGHTTSLLYYIQSIVINSPSISDRCMHMISVCNLSLQLPGFCLIWELPEGVNIIEQLKLIFNSRTYSSDYVDATPVITHLDTLKQILINIIQQITYETNIAYNNYTLAETEFNTFCETNQEQLQITMQPRIYGHSCKKQRINEI